MVNWTYPPRKILVPVDFGDASAKALSIGVSLSREFGSDLEVLHVEVLDAPPYFTHEQVEALETQRRHARAAAEHYLRRFAEQQGAPLATIVIADGAAADVILAHAKDADAIVMGTNERGRAAKFWMGSVAERVSRHAAVPVLVVHESSEGSPREYVDQLAEDARRRKDG
jgi:nucleotide-binding universal stress UspA family protein